MLKRILQRCDVAHENAYQLNEEQFAMIRRNGIGASDTSAILGAMDKFRNAEDILQNKLETTYTDAEKEVSMKPNVRKGRMLEPMILEWAERLLGTEVIKPQDMYRLKDYPHLTVNYDGLTLIDGELVPVEAKFVSTYGDKYYNFNDPNPVPLSVPPHADRLQALQDAAKHHGIPPYYLIQVQQQMMGTGSSRAILAALRDKYWEVYLFTVPVYPWMQEWLAVETFRFWNRVQKARRIA